MFITQLKLPLNQSCGKDLFIGRQFLSIKSKAPVYFETVVVVMAEIIKIHESRSIINLETTCIDCEGKELVTGDAVAFVPGLPCD